MVNKPPFFIIGCVRSGTTMLREILRQHPNLECPEETHFFRWADPFGTNRYDMVYTKNKLITEQQAMDGFSKEEFIDLYRDSSDRRVLMDRYMAKYLAKINNPNARWFDKTPQHVYGLFLIKKLYPHAKFIHIYRNPLNVAASLLKGQVMPKQSMIASINYWNEAMILIEAFKKIYVSDVLDVCYEEFCSTPQNTMKRVSDFIEEDMGKFQFELDNIHPERNNYLKILDDTQVSCVRVECAEFMRVYGYN